jgi:hypothetical protein
MPRSATTNRTEHAPGRQSDRTRVACTGLAPHIALDALSATAFLGNRRVPLRTGLSICRPESGTAPCPPDQLGQRSRRSPQRRHQRHCQPRLQALAVPPGRRRQLRPLSSSRPRLLHLLRRPRLINRPRQKALLRTDHSHRAPMTAAKWSMTRRPTPRSRPARCSLTRPVNRFASLAREPSLDQPDRPLWSIVRPRPGCRTQGVSSSAGDDR